MKNIYDEVVWKLSDTLGFVGDLTYVVTKQGTFRAGYKQPNLIEDVRYDGIEEHALAKIAITAKNHWDLVDIEALKDGKTVALGEVVGMPPASYYIDWIVL
jgi:hypothetical protein